MAGVARSTMREAVAAVAAADPAFASVVARAPMCTIGSGTRGGSHFDSLVKSVVAQQLSTKAADTISGRLSEALDHDVTPGGVLALDEELLRAAGLSRSKTRTIRGLAMAMHSGELDLDRAIESGDDNYLRTELQALWGIGRWTVEMFLMFDLHRLDIWPVGDLAMRRGWQVLHGADGDIAPRDIEVLGDPFRPYRSVAAWYCWWAVDGDNPSW